MLMEQLDYNLLFRWFVGLNMDDAVWHVTVYTKNRDRSLQADVAKKFFGLVVAEAQGLDLMSDEHFTPSPHGCAAIWCPGAGQRRTSAQPRASSRNRFCSLLSKIRAPWPMRSEERRVGEEGRAGWWPPHSS